MAQQHPRLQLETYPNIFAAWPRHPRASNGVGALPLTLRTAPHALGLGVLNLHPPCTMTKKKTDTFIGLKKSLTRKSAHRVS